jgi:hypothetical protein
MTQFVLPAVSKLKFHLNLAMIDRYIAVIASQQKDNRIYGLFPTWLKLLAGKALFYDNYGNATAWLDFVQRLLLER